MEIAPVYSRLEAQDKAPKITPLPRWIATADATAHFLTGSEVWSVKKRGYSESARKKRNQDQPHPPHCAAVTWLTAHWIAPLTLWENCNAGIYFISCRCCTQKTTTKHHRLTQIAQYVTFVTYEALQPNHHHKNNSEVSRNCRKRSTCVRPE